MHRALWIRRNYTPKLHSGDSGSCLILHPASSSRGDAYPCVLCFGRLLHPEAESGPAAQQRTLVFYSKRRSIGDHPSLLNLALLHAAVVRRDSTAFWTVFMTLSS